MTRLHRPVSIPGLLGSPVEGGTPLVLTTEGVVALGVAGGGGGELPDGVNPDDLLVWDGAQWLPAPPDGPPLSDIYIKIGDIEGVPPGDAPNDILVWTGAVWSSTDPADPPLSNIYLKTADYTPPTFLHDDLTDVTPDQHHVRYTDAEAIAAVGPHFSGDHDDLTNVTTDQHHPRYTDAEAIAAVGPHFSGDHDDLTNVLPDQHHPRYTDAEAIAAVDNGTYLKLTGGTMTGFLTLNADPTNPLHAATKQYVDATNLPEGGDANQALTKIDGQDYNVEWSGPYTPLSQGDFHETRHTGLYTGGELTFVGNVVTVAAGTGLIVDSWTDPTNPVYTPLSWVEQTIDVGVVTDRGRTTILINSAGNVQAIVGWPTEAKRDNILVGYVYHDYAGTGNIIGQNRVVLATNELGLNFWDFVSATQIFPLLVRGTGAVDPNPDLTFNITEQRWWAPGVNQGVLPQDPNFRTVPPKNPSSFYYVDSLGVLAAGVPGGNPTTLVDPARWESSPGVVDPISGSANRATIQRLYLTLAGNTVMMYGQTVYDNLSEAVNALNQDISEHVTPEVLSLASLVAFFIMEKGATDLDNGADVIVIDTDGIPISGGATPAHDHDTLYLRLDATNDPMQAPLDMGGNQINGLADPTAAQDAATKFYVDNLPPIDHDDLVNVLPDQHHPRYTDAEAIAAVGPHFSGDHADLTNVLPDQHHVRYTDAEAIAAVGPHFSGDHADLTNVQPDQHHTRYTDAEAIAALGPSLANYLPLSGGTLTGFLTLNANPTSPLHAATKQYVDAEVFSGDHGDLTGVTADQHHTRYTDGEAAAAAPVQEAPNDGQQYARQSLGWSVLPDPVLSHDALTGVTSDQHHVRYDDSEALAAMGDLNDLNTYNHDRYTDTEAVDALQNTLALYLPLAGGVMTGPINMGGSQVKGVANPTDLQDAVTRAYFEANDIGTVHTVSETAPTNPGVGDVWVDPSAIGENEYLKLIGGTMTGNIQMTTYSSENPGGGSLGVDWRSNYWSFRLGGTSNPAGISLDAYDTPVIYLKRTGDIELKGQQVIINYDTGTQFDGALILKQESTGYGRFGFFNGSWKTNLTLDHTEMNFYPDGAIALHLQAGSTSTTSSGYRGSYIQDDVALGTAAGDRRYIGGFRGNNGNSGFLDFMHLRKIAGTSWSTASFGIQRRTDASNQSSIWFDTTAIGIGIADPDSMSSAMGLVVNGLIGQKPATTGGTGSGDWAGLGVVNYWQWRRNTSSERYKHNINYDTAWLAGIDLSGTTATFTHDDGIDYISFIAERVFEAFEDDRVVTRDEDGLIENYQRDAVVAVLVEKVARLERLVELGALT